jgi:CRP/FNR family transcriptional regulator, cyclic AMP receptor protein
LPGGNRSAAAAKNHNYLDTADYLLKNTAVLLTSGMPVLGKRINFLRWVAMEIHWHLVEQDFFQGLAAEKREFTARAELRAIKKNQYLFNEGAIGDSAFYLEEGKVRINRLNPEGKETIVSIRQAGEMFGLAEILGERKRVSNAQAMTPCRVYEIKRKEFEILLQRHFPVARRVIEVLGRRLRYLGEQVEGLMVCDVSARLLRLLTFLCCHHIADLSDPPSPLRVPVKLTQDQIAAMIGSSQQTVSETLKKLKESGWIAIAGKEISILRPKEVFERVME